MAFDDENDRHRNGTLPHDPEADADEYAPESERRAPLIHTVGVSEIFAALPDVKWCVKGMAIGAGVTTSINGFGYSGKSLICQELALAKATGLPAFGLFPVDVGRVLHLDFESGFPVVARRYQRLAAAKRIQEASFEDRLRLGIMPAVTLDERRARDVYARTFEGFDLVIIDALRPAAPSLDENSSEMRRAIDVLNVAGEKSGAGVMLVHHSRKPTEGSDPAGRYMVRGSSAIFDACASVFMVAAEKGQPTRVVHHKCRLTGVPLGDFGFSVEDVAIGSDPKGGLRVVHMEAEQLAAKRAAGASEYTGQKARIADFLRTEGTFRGSRTAVCKRVRMNAQTFFAAMSELESCGAVEIGKDAIGDFVRWIGGTK